MTCAAFLMMPAMALADSTDLNLIVNSQAVYGDDESGQPYISEAGRTMIPLRMVSTSMNYQTDWQPDGSIHITSPDGKVDVSLRVDSADYSANGVAGKFETLPTLKNDRTYLPARDFSKLYGHIYWEEDSRTVWISQGTEKDYQVVGSKLLRADASGIQELALPKDLTILTGTGTDPIVAERSMDGQAYLGILTQEDRSQPVPLLRDEGDHLTPVAEVFASSSFYVYKGMVIYTDGSGAGGWSNPIDPNRLYITDLESGTTATYALDFVVNTATFDLLDGKTFVAVGQDGTTHEIDLDRLVKQ